MPTGTLYTVRFRNGTGLTSLDSVTLGHSSSNAAFVGPWADRPPEYWQRFVGTPVYTWEQLAQKLEAIIQEKTGASKAYMNQFKAEPYTQGSGGVTHCVVRWCERKNIGKLPPDVIKASMSAEFDLRTGRTEYLAFEDWELLKWQKYQPDDP
jgi:hypothetical protein